MSFNLRCNKRLDAYSITSSAIESTPDGTSMPITFVVLRLITSPNFVGT